MIFLPLCQALGFVKLTITFVRLSYNMMSYRTLDTEVSERTWGIAYLNVH